MKRHVLPVALIFIAFCFMPEGAAPWREIATVVVAAFAGYVMAMWDGVRS